MIGLAELLYWDSLIDLTSADDYGTWEIAWRANVLNVISANPVAETRLVAAEVIRRLLAEGLVAIRRDWDDPSLLDADEVERLLQSRRWAAPSHPRPRGILTPLEDARVRIRLMPEEVKALI